MWAVFSSGQRGIGGQAQRVGRRLSEAGARGRHGNFDPHFTPLEQDGLLDQGEDLVSEIFDSACPGLKEDDELGGAEAAGGA